jgi:blue copper oxidase
MMRILFVMLSLLGILLTPLSAQADWTVELDIKGHDLKKHNEALKIQLYLQAEDGPSVDIYVAVQLPDGQLLFLNGNTLFDATPSFSMETGAYTSTSPQADSRYGTVLEFAQLPRNIPSGRYQIYALAVNAGADVFDPNLWESTLSQASFYFIDNDNSLPIPPEMNGVLNAQGQKVFDLTIQKGQKSFLPDTQTDTFGFNGDYLGPTIRLSKGDNALFNVKNNLGEKTTVHWHGAHIPAIMDGGPHQIIEADTTWKPFFEIKQPAATLWYHPHLDGKTAEHVYKGLAGFFILEDDSSLGLPLPRNYGVDDIPVVVQDRRIAADGNMDSTLRNMSNIMGLRGEYMLVNGALTPTLESNAQVIRLRLLNGSNARIYNFGFGDNRDFYQIATGGGLLEASVPMKRLRLAPGERAEILVDLRQDSGQFLLLKSYSAEISPMTITNKMMRDPLDEQTFDVMSIRVGVAGNNGLAIPDKLVTIERLREEDAVVTRPFVLNEGMGNMGSSSDSSVDMAGMDTNTTDANSMDTTNTDMTGMDMSTTDNNTDMSGMDMGGMDGMDMNGVIGKDNASTFANLHERGMFTINDKVMDMNRIDEVVRLGDTEIWVISNKADMAHPFHIHDIQFQILDRDGKAPSAGEDGWKDTVLVLPGETVRVITRFDDFADSETPYMYHCHILEHEDAGMMGQFVVIP